MTDRPTLDALIQRGRDAVIVPAHARHYVAELARWAPHEPRRPAWPRWLTGGVLGAAAATAVAVVVLDAPAEPGPATRAAVESAPVRVGERVALAATAGTVYRVAVAEPARTEIVVERGEITARLWPGTASHHLALLGGGIEATATGTVYTLAIDDRGARVAVHEGTVMVRDRDGERAVARGTGWPATVTADTGAGAATRLLALSPPEPSGPAPTVPAAAVDAPPTPVADVPPDARADKPVGPDAAAAEPPTLRERWRLCRLLRGQGKLDAAARECLTIADANDATWAPIALVEAIRIELGPLAAPERALELARRMEREWPSHQLAGEARELACRALQQLGRGAECRAPTGDAIPR